MKKKAPNASKGHTGAMLWDITRSSPSPLHVDLVGSTAYVRNTRCTYLAVTVRGSSHCRRKQARHLQSWLQKQWGGAIEKPIRPPKTVMFSTANRAGHDPFFGLFRTEMSVRKRMQENYSKFTDELFDQFINHQPGASLD